jgi:hypothetical protein
VRIGCVKWGKALSTRTIFVTALLSVCVAGCGGEAEQAAAPTSTSTPSPTANATPTATPSASPELAQARSKQECVQLWNEDALDDSFQVTANEFVADLAPVDVYVSYEGSHCYVVMPIGKRRIAFFTAVDGRRPFSVPKREPLKQGERFRSNARADKTGRIKLTS